MALSSTDDSARQCSHLTSAIMALSTADNSSSSLDLEITKVDNTVLSFSVLDEVYSLVCSFLEDKDFDEDLQKELNIAYPQYNDMLRTRQDDLKRTDCAIVVAGDTSAGKSSLINKIIGHDIFYPTTLAATQVICRIRQSTSDMGYVKLWTKDNVQKNEFQIRGGNDDFFKDLKERLRPFTDRKRMEKGNEDVYFVDVSIPIEILEGNVTLVDTPGIGETDDLTRKLMDYLPNAVAFLFVVDVSRAGGMHQDRILKILKAVSDRKDDMPCFNPEDVLFVTNKWDVLEENNEDSDDDDETEVWDDVKEKVSDAWPEAKPENIYRICLKKRPRSRNADFYDKEFIRLKEKLKTITRKSDNIRLKSHQSFLQNFISQAEKGINARLNSILRSDDEQANLIMKHSDRLCRIQQKCAQILQELKDDQEKTSTNLSEKLFDRLQTEEMKNKILNPPNEKPIHQCMFLVQVIPKRIKTEIQRWMRSEEVLQEIRMIETKIDDRHKELELSIREVEDDIGMGSRVIKYVDGAATLAILYATSSVWLPVLIGSAVVVLGASLILSPAWIANFMSRSVEEKEAQINAVYNACINKFTKNSWKHEIYVMIERLIQKKASHLFKDFYPKQVDSLRHAIEYLSIERQKIKDRAENYEFLRTKFSKIKQKIGDP